MPKLPSISVLLPVYNGRKYVADSIKSILSQSEADFELIVIDDGSADDSYSIVQKFADSRIRTIRHENRGLAASLNVGLAEARGKYIARQDQDDISMPQRLEKQISYMRAHPECGLLGTWAQILEGEKMAARFHRHPTDADELCYELLFNNPFVHSSVMIRKTILDKVGGYSTDPSRQPPEDYELWSRISRSCRVANLSEVLVFYREIPGSMSRAGDSPFRKKLVTISAENIAFATGMETENPQIVNIAALTHLEKSLVRIKPDSREMLNILYRAIDKISEVQKKPLLRRKAWIRTAKNRLLAVSLNTPFWQKISEPSLVRRVLKSIRNQSGVLI